MTFELFATISGNDVWNTNARYNARFCGVICGFVECTIIAQLNPESSEFLDVSMFKTAL